MQSPGNPVDVLLKDQLFLAGIQLVFQLSGYDKRPSAPQIDGKVVNPLAGSRVNCVA